MEVFILLLTLSMADLRSPAIFLGGINRLHSMGVKVKEINPEIIVMAAKVMANSLKILPISPPINRIGIKTASRDIDIETIVKPISRDPSSEATKGDSPNSTRRII